MRRLLTAAAFIVAAQHSAQRLEAQQPAAGALTIVAPAAPGGGWDQTARVMQQVLRDAGLARSVQVVNAAGAAGTIGLARFVSAERGNPDALLVTGLVMVSGIVMNQSPVTLADVTPVARLSGEYEVIVVPASSPLRSLADLVALFRANPRSVSWGGGSAGGTDEILVRLLAKEVGVAPDGVNYIAYSGGGQALASILGGHVTAAVSGLGEFGSQIESGELRALGISSPQRIGDVAIPTLREQGVTLDLLNWRGVVAPAGLTRAEQRRVTDLVRAMAGSPHWKEALRRNGWADIYLEGDDFARFISSETARVGPLVASANRTTRRFDSFELFVLIGGMLAVVAAVVSAVRRTGDAPLTDVQPPANRTALATLLAALVIGALLMDVTGFVIAATIMFWLTARAFGSRRHVRDAVLGLTIAAVIHAAFTLGLGVHLPTGLFG